MFPTLDVNLRKTHTTMTTPTTSRPPLILASGSPRRQKILAQQGLAFEVLKTDASEVSFPHDPERTVTTNAAAKLAAARTRPGTLDAAVLAADTIVWFDGRIYGKPADLAEAATFLRQLSGQTHTVFTGVAYAAAHDATVRTLCVRSDVTFKKLDEATLSDYLVRVNPIDRAGAYDIDMSGTMLIAAYTGSCENIMGLPLEALRTFGLI